MPAVQMPEVVSCRSLPLNCTYEGCNYSNRDVCGIILHLRTHFIYETSHSDMEKATFEFKDGVYKCLDCDRLTKCKLSFMEHVRHHILKFPYFCRRCLQSVGSIFELRKHSSSDHPKTPLQLGFGETNGRLETIMSLLGPVPQVFSFETDATGSSKNSRDVDVHTNYFAETIEIQTSAEIAQKVCSVEKNKADTTSQQFQNVTNEPLLKVKRSIPVFRRIAPKPSRDCDKRLPLTIIRNIPTSDFTQKGDATNKAPSVRMGKFLFSTGKFQCLTCGFKSSNEESFQRHVGMHFHNGEPKICQNNCSNGHCPYVLGILTLMRNRHSDSSRLGNNSTPKGHDVEDGANRVDSSPKATPAQEICVSASSHQQSLSDFTSISKSMELGDAFAVSADSANPDKDALDIASKESPQSAVLRFSEKCLASLRSKAGKLLDFSSIADDGTIVEKNGQNLCDRIAPSDSFNCDTPVNKLCSESSNNKLSTQDSPINLNDDDDDDDNDVADAEVNSELSYRTSTNSQLLGYQKYVRDKTPLSTLCSKCSYSCNCTVQLKYHVDTCHNSGPDKKNEFGCSECFFSGTSKQILIWHMSHHIGHHSLTFFVCSYCSHLSSSESSIMKHLEKSHANQISSFKTEVTKVDYMDGIFKCPICKAGFPWGNLFFRHIASQHKLQELSDYLTTMYDEKICPEVISVPKCLLSDASVYEGSSLTDTQEANENEVYFCPDCDICFKSSDEFINHCSRHEGAGKKETATIGNFLKLLSRSSDSNTDKLERNELPNLHVDQNTFTDFASSPKVSSPNKNVDVKAKNLFKKKKKDSGSCDGRNLKSGVGLNGQTQTGILYKSHNNRTKKYRTPMASRRACVSVSPARVPTLPRNIDTSSDFIKSLPDTFVFREAIKCPKCYYSDRVRLNLVRHYNGHFQELSKSKDSEDALNPVSQSGLSFSLWQPDNSPNDKESSADSKSSSDEKKLPVSDKVSTVSKNLENSLCQKDDRLLERGSTAPTVPFFGQYLENHARKVFKKISCISCSATFSDEDDHFKHTRDVHSSAYYVCRCCGIMVHGLFYAHKHYKEKHPGSQVLVDPYISSKKTLKKVKTREVTDAKIETDNNSPVNNQAKRKDKSEFSSSSVNSSNSTDFYKTEDQMSVDADKCLRESEQPDFQSVSRQSACKDVKESVNGSVFVSTNSSVSLANHQFGTNVSHGNSVCSTSQFNSNPVSDLSNLDNTLMLSLFANLLASSMTSNQTVAPMQLPLPAVSQISASGVPVTQCLAAQKSEAEKSTAQAPLIPVSQVETFATQFAAALSSWSSSNFQPYSTPVASYFANWLMAGLTAVNTSNSWPNFGSVADVARSSAPGMNALNAFLASGGASSVGEISNLLAGKIDATVHVDSKSSSVPGDSCKKIGRCHDDDNRLDCVSVNGTSKVPSSDSGSMLPPDSDQLYSSEAESLASSNSRSSRSTVTSRDHSKPRLGKRHKKKSSKLYSNSDVSENDIDTSSVDGFKTTSLDSVSNKDKTSNIKSTPRFCCHLCQYSTPKLDHFKDHLAVHFLKVKVDTQTWKPVLQRCGFCSYRTYCNEDFEEHLLTHTVEKPIQCHYCPFSTFTKSSILRHLNRCHSDLEPKFRKRQNTSIKKRACSSVINFEPILKIENVLTLMPIAIKCLQNDHGLKCIDLKIYKQSS